MATATNTQGSAWRRFIKAIEPWYDWGSSMFERLDGEGEGDGRFFSLEWFGLHITVFYGRQPAKAVG